MKTIFFDIGGVLVDLRWQEAGGIWADRTGRPAEELRSLLLGEGRKDAFERGELDTESYFAAVTDAAGAPELRDAAEEAFRALVGARPWVAPALDRLALRYKLALISNIDAVHYACFDAEPTYRGLERSWLSFRNGRLKPEPEAFAQAMRNAHVREPDEALLIDDRVENVRAAWKLGMRALLVPDEAAFRSALDGLLETVRDCPYEKERDCSRTCPDFRTCRGALRRPGRA